MALGSDALELPRPFGPYTLVRRLAVGGMAEVYVAKTKGIGGFEKLVALKVIHPTFSEDEQFVRMLVEEAKLSVLLNHTNVVQTFDLGCIDDTYFIVMELVEGADTYRLAKAMRKRRAQLPLDVCAYIVAEVCAALDYAHRKRDSSGAPLNIVHRDVSPQNVLLSFAGDVKLADFGIAKAALRTQDTQVGVIKGKYYYMSPEQAWGDPMDNRSDIFSAGVVLHELVTGQMLYSADNLPDLLDKVRRAELDPPSTRRGDVPAELDAIVMKALAAKPEDRYDSAHDFGQALTQFLYKHRPSFTAARVAKLMAQLFPKEYEAVTGISPQSTEKLLSTNHNLMQSTSSQLMQLEEYTHGGKSVIFNLNETRDDLPKPKRKASASSSSSSATTRPPRRRAPPPSDDEDEDAPTMLLDRAKLATEGSLEFEVDMDSGSEPTSDVISDLGADLPDADEDATVIETSRELAARMEALLDEERVKSGEEPLPGSTPSRRDEATIELSESIAEDVEMFSLPRSEAPSERGEPTVEYERNTPVVIGLDPKDLRELRGENKTPKWLKGLVFVLALAVVAGGALFVFRPAATPLVRIISEPPGAEVRVDDQVIGTPTPLELRQMVVGDERRIEVRLPGYVPWRTHLLVHEGEQELRADLEPQMRSLQVSSDPQGAEVRIDGVLQGRTPLRLGEHRVDTHINMSVSTDGHRPVAREIVMRPGEGAQVEDFDLPPLGEQ